VQVVNGQQERSASRKRAERRQRRHADRPLVDLVLRRVTVVAQQRHLEDASLRSRQRRQGIVDDQIEQVSERREGQPGFRARRRARQYPPPARGRGLERPAPQRGLPDPRLALEHDRARLPIGRLDRIQERRQFAIARDQLFRRSSPLKSSPPGRQAVRLSPFRLKR